MSADVLPLSLMSLWASHKRECRPVGSIVPDARADRLPGVRVCGFGFQIVDEQAALAAMKKEP